MKQNSNWSAIMVQISYTIYRVQVAFNDLKHYGSSNGVFGENNSTYAVSDTFRIILET